MVCFVEYVATDVHKVHTLPMNLKSKPMKSRPSENKRATTDSIQIQKTASLKLFQITTDWQFNIFEAWPKQIFLVKFLWLDFPGKIISNFQGNPFRVENFLLKFCSSTFQGKIFQEKLC